MEIKDYVGALAGKGRIVAAVAIIVGFLAVVVFIFQPQRYRASATIAIPIPPSTTTSALAAVSEAYADFNGALTTDVVAERAATDAGVQTSAVKGHLSVSRLAGSSVAQVTYDGPDKDHATEIAKAASVQALALVISARLAPLEQQLTLAQTAYNDANDEYKTFVEESSVYNDSYFVAQQRRINHLKDQLGNAEANGNTQLAAGYQARIDQKNALISQQLADFQRLTSTRQSALEAYTSAQQSELSEKGLLQSITEGGQVSISGPSGAPRLTGLIKAVVPAVVVATGLAIAMIVLLEVVGPVRLPKRRRSDDGGDGDAADAGQPEASEDEGSDEDEEPERDPAGRRVHTRA